MIYSFDTKIAEQYGVDEAIMLNHIAYWVFFNQAHDKNYYDGRYWTWATLKGIAEIFPFWSVSTIRRVLTSLKEKGCIVTGCYNQRAADRTLWYSLSDELFQNEHFHLLKSTNGNAEINRALPDIYTTDNKKKDTIVSKERAKAQPLPQVAALPLPYNSTRFKTLWETLCSQPKWRKKTQNALQISLKKLASVSEAEAIAAMEDSIENGWQGIFPKKGQKPQETPRERTIDIKDILK